jgi:CDP-6-deoxy-D-xylo-4-hexulose-3-dehydrase
MEEIMPIAKKHNLKVLEDSCEAHGASINGKKAGSYGDMATLSFYVAHNITTGEGGMVFTNNKSYNHMLKSIREFGRIDQEGARFVEVGKLGIYDKRYVFERLGYNLRMTDLEASFGIEQFKKMDKLNEKRIENANYFTDEFKKFDNLVKLPSIKKGVVHTYYGYPIIIRKNAPFKRHDMVTFLENNLIETRPFFAGTLPDQPAFLNKKIKVIGDLHVSRWIRDNAIFIGCHAAIGEEERNYVVNKISDFLKKF